MKGPPPDQTRAEGSRGQKRPRDSPGANEIASLEAASDARSPGVEAARREGAALVAAGKAAEADALLTRALQASPGDHIMLGSR